MTNIKRRMINESFYKSDHDFRLRRDFDKKNRTVSTYKHLKSLGKILMIILGLRLLSPINMTVLRRTP